LKQLSKRPILNWIVFTWNHNFIKIKYDSSEDFREIIKCIEAEIASKEIIGEKQKYYTIVILKKNKLYVFYD
jgi:hypothetical protein